MRTTSPIDKTGHMSSKTVHLLPTTWVTWSQSSQTSASTWMTTVSLKCSRTMPTLPSTRKSSKTRWPTTFATSDFQTEPKLRWTKTLIFISFSRTIKRTLIKTYSWLTQSQTQARQSQMRKIPKVSRAYRLNLRMSLGYNLWFSRKNQKLQIARRVKFLFSQLYS